jgi:subtilisin family serine protease
MMGSASGAVVSWIGRLHAPRGPALAIALLCSVCLGAAARPAQASVADAQRALEDRIVPDELIVYFRAGVGRQAHRAFRGSFAARLGDPRAAALDELLRRGQAVGLRRVFRGLEDAQGRLLMTARQRVSRQLEHRVERPGRRRQLARGLDRVPDLENIFVLELAEPMTAEELLGLAGELAGTEWVVWAQPNFIYQLDSQPLPAEAYVPNDRYVSTDRLTWAQGAVSPDFPDLYGIRNVRAIEAWNTFDLDGSGSFDPGEPKPGEGIVVAVIDSGLDRTHPDIVGNVWSNPLEIAGNGIDDDGNDLIDDVNGWDFVNDDADPQDGHGHGTHVAGTVASVANNIEGVVGVAPFVKIMPLKGLGDSGTGPSTALAAAVEYAASMGADILSNSWGASVHDPLIEAAFITAEALGALSVAAAGNATQDVAAHTPAAYETTLAVAAVDHDDVVASFSNFGLKIDVSAPGVDTLSLNANAGANLTAQNKPHRVVDTDYLLGNGTSMACPHVSGAAAVLMTWYPDETAREIWGRLGGGATPIDALNPGFEGLLGAGRIDLLDSLTATPIPLLEIRNVESAGLEPGSSATLVVTLRNFWAEVVNLQATLVSLSADLTVTAASASYGDLGAGEQASNAAEPLALEVAPEAVYGQTFDLELSLTDDNGYAAVFPLTLEINFFEDISQSVGLPKSTGIPWHLVVQDYNGDDLSDVNLTDGFFHLAPYRQEEDGTFSSDIDANLTGMFIDQPLFADIDNDGDLDAFMFGDTADLGSKLFLNDGTGSFTDISATSGIDSSVLVRAATAFDFDRDGDIDVIGVGNATRSGNPLHNVYVLRNSGDYTFSDWWDWSIYSPTPLVALDAIRALDYDGDGDQDLALLGLSGGESLSLWQNQGRGRFLNLTATAFPGGARGNAIGLATADYDNDGDIDIFVGGIRPGDGGLPMALYRNNGDGTFEDVITSTGDLALTNLWTHYWGTEFFDYDNDGDLDLYITSDHTPAREGLVTPRTNSVFRNEGDGSFTSVTDVAFGAGVAPHLGVAGIGDIDRDGALDVYAPSSDVFGSPNVGGMLRNVVGGAQNFLQIELVAIESVPGAYGARILVEAGGSIQTREVHTSPMNPDFAHFGLGDAAQADHIEIRWPRGIVQVLHNVPANQRRVVHEIAQDCPGSQDDDGDGVCNEVDNCLVLPNGIHDASNQVDTDGDGFGNACDPDYDNNGVVGVPDHTILLNTFGLSLGDPEYNPDVDSDGDDAIGDSDFETFSAFSNQAPGPSGLACADASGATAPCHDLHGSGDTDGDRVVNAEDSCALQRNGLVDASNQIDSNQDGFGNACDPDFDNDGVVRQSDFAALGAAFGTALGDPDYDPDLDSNGDDSIGAADYGVLTAFLDDPPGPSGLACADPSGATVPCYVQYTDGDTDGDHVINRQDNCVLLRNGLLDGSNQIDSNWDGLGNACDPDYDNNGVVRGRDRAALNATLGTIQGEDPDYDPDIDHNGDNTIDGADREILNLFFREAPGPSGLKCADPLATTVPCVAEP